MRDGKTRERGQALRTSLAAFSALLSVLKG